MKIDPIITKIIKSNALDDITLLIKVKSSNFTFSNYITSNKQNNLREQIFKQEIDLLFVELVDFNIQKYFSNISTIQVKTNVRNVKYIFQLDNIEGIKYLNTSSSLLLLLL